MFQTKKIKSYQFGIVAEWVTIVFLWFKGYKILKKRYKTFLGEIDIIAQKDKNIVAIEVKARKKMVHKNGFLIDGVLGEAQKRRIKRAAIAFIALNFKKYHQYSLRFDLVVVCPCKLPLHLVGFWE